MSDAGNTFEVGDLVTSRWSSSGAVWRVLAVESRRNTVTGSWEQLLDLESVKTGRKSAGYRMSGDVVLAPESRLLAVDKPVVSEARKAAVADAVRNLKFTQRNGRRAPWLPGGVFNHDPELADLLVDFLEGLVK